MSTFQDRMKDLYGVDSTRIVLLLLENMIWPILLVTFVGFSALAPRIFTSSANVQFILFSSAALGTLALAESLCLLSGNFDLSISAIAGFSGLATALIITEHLPWLPGEAGIVIILLIGGFIGLLNGISVGIIGVNPFLQTLAFLIIFQQLMPVISTFGIQNLPETYTFLGGGKVGQVPAAVLVVLLLYAAAWFVLNYTPTGVAVYAVGGDETASREAGIDTTRVIVGVYVVSGVLSGLAGLLLTGSLGAATTSLASGQLFPAFAAAVIGGISLFGGRGNILGALGGVLLLGTIQTGLVMIDIDPKVVQVVNGVILLGAVLLYTAEARIRQLFLAS